jgi:hypothetical protein
MTLIDRAKGSAGTFQRGKSPAVTGRKRISQTLPLFVANRRRKSDGTQQAWVNSRNLLTIASESKNRQLYLFPAPGQTALCHSHPTHSDGFGLLNPFPFSTLQVFHFIQSRARHRGEPAKRVHDEVAFRSVDECGLHHGTLHIIAVIARLWGEKVLCTSLRHPRENHPHP